MVLRLPKKKNKTPKVTALALARSRKITGRLNKDDVDNARLALKDATPTEMKRYAASVARMQASNKAKNKFSGGAYSPISKGGMKVIKTGQTKGPAGRKR